MDGTHTGSQADTRGGAPREAVTIWGDFTCPWSYAAWRRSELLADAGVGVDWRTVEHDPWRHLRPVDVADRFQTLRGELPDVLGHLRPGETLPCTLAGHVPFTGAATSAYAEAYEAGVARSARQVLFEAFWRHGVDLGDARVVRALLVDTMLAGHSDSEPVRLWGHALDVTGGPISTGAWHRIRDWRSQWRELGGTVPALLTPSGQAVVGAEALDWLGDAVAARVPDAWDDPGREHHAA